MLEFHSLLLLFSNNFFLNTFPCLVSLHIGLSNQEILNSEIAVITNYFHLRRAERLATRMGFTNIKGIPAACPPVYVLHNYVREICAYVKLNLRILLTGEPKKIQNTL